jgi:hypothetical protein
MSLSQRGATDVEPLVNAIMLWLSLNFALPLGADQPLIRQVPPDRLVAIHYGGMSGRPPDLNILGAYDARTRTIYLRDDWDSRNATDVSVLVHELVHYLQDRAGLSFECPATREAPAYAAQQRWMEFYGTDLHAAFGIDAMTLKLRTACLPN